ncbi:MAG: DUF2007 domain-containing protein [Alphaproteobacteria bacterium]|nr:DUF2007 domain-containing protein [Alphaproteobacteria bacterium]
MRQLLQTNDPVLISFIESLLKGNDIAVVVLDQNMSVLEGSIGVLQRRIMVPDDNFPQACRILREADLGEWLKRDDTQ